MLVKILKVCVCCMCVVCVCVYVSMCVVCVCIYVCMLCIYLHMYMFCVCVFLFVRIILAVKRGCLFFQASSFFFFLESIYKVFIFFSVFPNALTIFSNVPI